MPSVFCYRGGMTREEAIIRKQELERKRNALVDQLCDVDAQSASMSAGGGSKSYTNRSVAELKAKIAFVEKEITRISARLGECASPDKPRIVGIGFAS